MCVYGVPWARSQGTGAAGVAVAMAGTTLPPTWVVAYDAWGFRTLPCEYTPYVLAVRRRTADGETLDEEGAVEVTVEFDENGIACVEDVEVRTTHGMVVDPWRTCGPWHSSLPSRLRT